MYLCNVVRAEISVFTAPRKERNICFFYFKKLMCSLLTKQTHRFDESGTGGNKHCKYKPKNGYLQVNVKFLWLNNVKYPQSYYIPFQRGQAHRANVTHQCSSIEIMSSFLNNDPMRMLCQQWLYVQNISAHGGQYGYGYD